MHIETCNKLYALQAKKYFELKNVAFVFEIVVLPEINWDYFLCKYLINI